MDTATCTNLVHRTAVNAGRDPVEAMREFIDVVRSMKTARRESERLYAELQELGRQYGHYRNGDPYDPELLLDERALNRRYSQLKARLKAENRTLSIRSQQATALVGGAIRFVHGRAEVEDITADTSMVAEDGSELAVLYDPDDGQPIVLHMQLP